MFKHQELINELHKLNKFANRLTRNTTNAEDLLQSTVLRALEKNDYFEDGTNLFGWTSKIMFNIFISDYRKKAKFEIPYDPEYYIDQVSVGPSQEIYADLAIIKNSIMCLSKEHYEILILLAVYELSYDEIAQKLNVPVGTVRSRLSRARTNL